MSVKEVTALRKEGKLKEAYELARQELKEDPNEWTRMSMFWVARDIVQKRLIPNKCTTQAVQWLGFMKSLLPKMMDNSGMGQQAYQMLRKQVLPNFDIIKAASELSKTDPIKAYADITAKLGTGGQAIDEGLHNDYGWVIYRYLRANAGAMSSVEIRKLLRDYMCLTNERPSLLHSMILNFAMNFSKDHSDFNFYNFLVLWGVDNLRSEDYHDCRGTKSVIPSLIQRICRVLVDSGQVTDVGDFAGKFGKRADTVLDHLRQSCFWRLMNLHSNGEMQALMQEFDAYASAYSHLGASHWHSEILKIACRFMTESHAAAFIPFIMKWDDKGNFRPEDWKKETNDKGDEFQSLAVRAAKKSFDLFKHTPTLRQDQDALAWLVGMYSRVVGHDSNDDWSVRNFATACLWSGDASRAASVYKKLLEHMGDKYYLWSELAGCVADHSLRIGLLLKAKKLERNEDFLGDVRLALAASYLQVGASGAAKSELDSYAKHRAEKGWSLPDNYRELSKALQECDSNGISVDEQELIMAAEDFVFADHDWKEFVLAEKWTHEGVEHCYLTNGDKLSFSIKAKRFPVLRKSKPGDIVAARCKVVEQQVPDPKSSVWNRRLISTYSVTPFVMKKSSVEPWSVLPVKYGVVDYVNEQKHVVHIVTQDSEQTFAETKDSRMAIDSFVRFREYRKTRNSETKTMAAQVEPCDRAEALQHMRSRIVVVDDVNPSKRLFHVVLGEGQVSDIVRYSQTELRPSIGQFLKITYCIKTNKEGKKRIKFLDIRETDEVCPNVTKQISGWLDLKCRDRDWTFDEDDSNPYPPDFAFINDYYVHKSVLRKHNITKNCYVVASLVLSGDNKWRVYDLEVE